MEMDTRDQIIQTFQKFDVTGTKTIEWDQLMRVMKFLSPSYAECDAESALAAAGKLRNGAIAYEDFVDWVFQHPVDALARKVKLQEPELTRMGSKEKDARREAAKIANMKQQNRRAGVSSECIDKRKVDNYEKPFFPKDENSRSFIMRTLTQNEKMKVICGHLEVKDLEDLINAFRPDEFFAGAEIISQGDEGDCLYIIEYGQVDVFVARPGASSQLESGGIGTKVVSYGPGVLFGELALLYSTPRAATVIAATNNVKVWALDQLDFKMLLAQSTDHQHTVYEGWLRQVDALSSLNYYELSRLSDHLESTLFEEEEVIFKQGEPGSTFFLLEEGKCAAYLDGPQGEKEVARYVNQGDYFGELSLLLGAPRKATVRAVEGGCIVASISKDVFLDILGPLSDMLRERGSESKYPRYDDVVNGLA